MEGEALPQAGPHSQLVVEESGRPEDGGAAELRKYFRFISAKNLSLITGLVIRWFLTTSSAVSESVISSSSSLKPDWSTPGPRSGQLSYAIKTHLKAPKAPNKGNYFLCMEANLMP